VSQFLVALWILNWLFALFALPFFLSFAPTIESVVQWFYLAAAALSHFGLLAAIPVILLSAFWGAVRLFFRSDSVVYWVVPIVMTVFFVVLAIDVLVFFQYRFHINRFALAMMFGGAATDIFSFGLTTWIWAIAFVLIVFLCQSGLLFLARRLAVLVSRRFAIGLVLALGLVCLTVQVSHAVAEAKNLVHIVRLKEYLPWYFPLEASGSLVSSGLIAPRPGLFSAEQFEPIKSQIHFPQESLRCEAPSQRENVLIVVIDSLRFDALNPEIMPMLDDFAHKAHRFQNHLSGGNATPSGIFSLFYGIPANYWDAIYTQEIGSPFVDRAFASGYEVGVFTSASLVYPPFGKMLFSKVPDLKMERRGPSGEVLNSAWERDARAVDEWSDFWTRSGNEPRLGFVFLDAPHAYSHPPDRAPFQPAWKEPLYLKLREGIDSRPMVNLYRNAVSFVDTQIGRMLSVLSATGSSENTWVVITADHGQEFNDSGKNYWGHASAFSDAQIHVPLVVRVPRASPAQVSAPTQHFDVAPTLMQRVFGCSNDPRDYSFGRDLYSEPVRRWRYAGIGDDFAIVREQDIIRVRRKKEVVFTDQRLNEQNPTSDEFRLVSSVLQEVNRFYHAKQ
jgi:membrane-anchored protein YejM (alkaline phosphatase superfamily)